MNGTRSGADPETQLTVNSGDMDLQQINDFLATRAMGWANDGANWIKTEAEDYRWAPFGQKFTTTIPKRDWNPARVEEHAWRAVDAVQRRFPGWRLELTGGNRTHPYISVVGGAVDHDQTISHPWRAVFRGHADPSLDADQVHGAAYHELRTFAICLAVIQALEGEVDVRTQSDDPITEVA